MTNRLRCSALPCPHSLYVSGHVVPFVWVYRPRDGAYGLQATLGSPFLKRNFKILKKHSIISVWLICLTLPKFPTAYQLLNQTPYKWLKMFRANTIYEHSLESMSACKRLKRNYGINYVQLSTRARLTKMLPAFKYLLGQVQGQMPTMGDAFFLEISSPSRAQLDVVSQLSEHAVFINRELPRVLDHKRASLLTVGNPPWKVASRTVMNLEHTSYTCMQS